MEERGTIWLESGIAVPEDPSYADLVRSLAAEIIVEHSDDEGAYEGDTWYLLRRERQWGLVNIGWGSCSGCDALQQAGNAVEDLRDLRRQIAHGVIWRESAAALLAYIESKDWTLDYSGSPAFLDRARRALDAVINGPEIARPAGGRA